MSKYIARNAPPEARCTGCVAKPTAADKHDMELCLSLPPCLPSPPQCQEVGKDYPDRAIIWVKA